MDKVRAFQAKTAPGNEFEEVPIRFNVAPRTVCLPWEMKSSSGLLPPPPLPKHALENMARISEMLKQEEDNLRTGNLMGSGEAKYENAGLDNYAVVQNNLSECSRRILFFANRAYCSSVFNSSVCCGDARDRPDRRPAVAPSTPRASCVLPQVFGQR